MPTGIPYRYRLADDLSVVSPGYLGDAEAAEAAAEAVARQARPADAPTGTPPTTSPTTAPGRAPTAGEGSRPSVVCAPLR